MPLDKPYLDVPGTTVFDAEQSREGYHLNQFCMSLIMKDPHIKARNMVVDIDHPKIGPMKTLGLPIKSTGALTQIRQPAPWLGQHTEDVLREIGYAEGDIRELFAAGVVYDSACCAAPATTEQE
jgi:hypothetical protein